MKKWRILYNGHWYKLQFKVWWFWLDVTELDPYARTRGPRKFWFKVEAKDYAVEYTERRRAEQSKRDLNRKKFKVVEEFEL